MRITFAAAAIAALALFAGAVVAQNGLPDIGIKDNLALGVVKEVGAQKIVVETKDGVIDSVLVSTTVFKRLPPDNLSLKAATPSSLSELTVGDRVLLTGKVSDDKKTIITTAVYLVKGTDLAEQQAKQRAEWQRRGIAGRVKAVDTASGEITPKADARFLKYSAESARYADAVESSIGQISPEDMIQALGDKSEDGASFSAEELITGAFQTVAGTVKSVDAAKNEVVITELKTKQDVIIQIKSSSLLKKFPEEIAQRLARFQMMMASGAVPPAAGNRPPQGRPGGEGGQGRPGMQGGGMRGDINDMLNRFPSITAGDLKEGDMIAVSSPKTNDPGRLTAIKLLAGVEPFLTMQQASSGGRRGSQGVSGGLNIPGLDSVEF
jgi:hypothetical protein